MKVLLFANGPVQPGSLLRDTLQQAGAAQIICADGGALHAQALGLHPQHIFGDLDSLSPQQVADFRAAGAVIHQYDAEKDETDLELALRYCQKIAAQPLYIIGGFGGRIDQSLANIHLLSQPAWRNSQAIFVDGEQSLRLLPPGSHALQGQAGDTVSLLALTAAVTSIRTRDLQYPLQGEDLRRGSSRGISNVMLRQQAEVSLRSGLLLLVQTRGRA